MALVTIQQLLTELSPGLLGPKLRRNITNFMLSRGVDPAEVAKPMRLVHGSEQSARSGVLCNNAHSRCLVKYPPAPVFGKQPMDRTTFEH